MTEQQFTTRTVLLSLALGVTIYYSLPILVDMVFRALGV